MRKLLIHQRQLVDYFIFFLVAELYYEIGIPPTAVGGLLHFPLVAELYMKLESHQRQLVDYFIFFLVAELYMKLESHQRQLVDYFIFFLVAELYYEIEIPPTAVGGWFRSS